MTAVNVVSSSTATIPQIGRKCGPFYYGGRVYVFVAVPGDGEIRVYSATYDDSSGFGTFAETDASNNPTNAGWTSGINSLYVVEDPTNAGTFHMVALGRTGANTYEMEYDRFDATNTTNDSNGSWEVTNEDIASFTNDGSSQGQAAIAIRSDGDRS